MIICPYKPEKYRKYGTFLKNKAIYRMGQKIQETQEIQDMPGALQYSTLTLDLDL